MPYNIETIVFELNTILHDDSDLKSFEIIPQPNSQSSSPVFHVDHHLGLESWCVKDVYRCVHQKLRTELGVESRINYLCVALLLNPSVKTYWNVRKTLVMNGNLDIEAELNFVAIIQSQYPKNQELVNVRKWLIMRLFHHSQIPPSVKFCQKEFELVHKLASQHVNNHAAWNHAEWFLPFAVYAGFDVPTLWESSRMWISTNLSDYSGMHFHQELLVFMVMESRAESWNFKKKILTSALEFLSKIYERCVAFPENVGASYYKICLFIVDLELNENLIEFYGNYESLWNHRRFLCFFLASNSSDIMSDLCLRRFFHLLDIPHPENDCRGLTRKIDQRFLQKIAEKNSQERCIERHIKWVDHLKIYPTGS